jgi:hypothetical protein
LLLSIFVSTSGKALSNTKKTEPMNRKMVTLLKDTATVLTQGSKSFKVTYMVELLIFLYSAIETTNFGCPTLSAKSDILMNALYVVETSTNDKITNACSLSYS